AAFVRWNTHSSSRASRWMRQHSTRWKRNGRPPNNRKHREADLNANTQTPALIDKFGRKVEYVRLSVTDRCDFRCVYCMAEDMTFLPRSEILSLEELHRIAATFVSLGVKKIRLTGGEPLIRRDVITLVRRLGELPGL